MRLEDIMGCLEHGYSAICINPSENFRRDCQDYYLMEEFEFGKQLIQGLNRYDDGESPTTPLSGCDKSAASSENRGASEEASEPLRRKRRFEQNTHTPKKLFCTRS